MPTDGYVHRDDRVTLVPSKEILKQGIGFIPRSFASTGAKTQETRLSIYFPTGSTAGAPMPISRPHALGRVPSQYTVVNLQRDPAAGPPGVVFARFPWATRTRVTLQCSTDQTWAEIVLR